MKKTSSTLRLIKDNQGLKTSGIYCIPCECGKVYVGQTASTIETRYQEHMTPAHWPYRKVNCSRTPTKHRTQNPI